MKHMAITAGSFLLVLFFLQSNVSCNKPNAPDCLKSTGDIIKEERTIGYFHSIELHDNVNLQLNQASQQKLVVEAGKNLMSKITFDVTADSVLVIHNQNSCNWVRSYDKPINVYLNFINLLSIEYRSVGNIINLDTLRLDSLNIDVREGAGLIDLKINTPLCSSNIHYGTADIKLSGRAGLCYVFSSGLGLIDNRLLESEILYTNNRSSNDIYIKSSKVIEATIENIGNIYYYGNPYEVTLNQTGSGELIKLD